MLHNQQQTTQFKHQPTSHTAVYNFKTHTHTR